MKKNKNIIIAFLLFILLIIYIYVCAIEGIPSDIVLFQGEELDIKTIFGMNIVSENEYKSVLTSSQVEEESETLGTTNVEIKLFNTFTVKDVSVSVIERTTVIPVRTNCWTKVIYKWSASCWYV